MATRTAWPKKLQITCCWYQLKCIKSEKNSCCSVCFKREKQKQNIFTKTRSHVKVLRGLKNKLNYLLLVYQLKMHKK